MNYIDERKKLEGAFLMGAKKDEEFGEMLVTDPESALKRVGFVVPGLKIGVIQEKEGELTLVVPEDLSEGKISKLEMAMISGGSAGDVPSLPDTLNSLMYGVTFGTVAVSDSYQVGSSGSNLFNDIGTTANYVANWFAGW